MGVTKCPTQACTIPLVDSSVDANNAINHQAETIVMHDHLSDILAQVDEDLLAPAVDVNIVVDDFLLQEQVN